MGIEKLEVGRQKTESLENIIQKICTYPRLFVWLSIVNTKKQKSLTPVGLGLVVEVEGFEPPTLCL